MEDEWDAPMELICAHELEALREELAMVKLQRDSALAALRRMEQPITYLSGSTTVPEWLKNARVLI